MCLEQMGCSQRKKMLKSIWVRTELMMELRKSASLRNYFHHKVTKNTKLFFVKKIRSCALCASVVNHEEAIESVWARFKNTSGKSPSHKIPSKVTTNTRKTGSDNFADGTAAISFSGVNIEITTRK